MMDKASSNKDQTGASVVEFLVAAPVLFMMGLGTLQAGLLYHSKTIVNYATFEAARVGATQHAMPGPMIDELGFRLAPLFGGDGTMNKAAEAMARSAVEVESPVNLDGSVAPPTQVKILNPTLESFDMWGTNSLENSNRTAIPNSHLKHQDPDAGANTAGMTLADANLLKIQVTHGVELKVPFINKLILEALAALPGDATKKAYYLAGRFPITSTATVRMQSEAWKEGIVLSNAPTPVVNAPDPTLGVVPDDGTGGQAPFTPLPDGGPDCNDNGLLNALINPDPVLSSCAVDVGGNGGGGDGSGGQSCA